MGFFKRMQEKKDRKYEETMKRTNTKMRIAVLKREIVTQKTEDPDKVKLQLLNRDWKELCNMSEVFESYASIDLFLSKFGEKLEELEDKYL